ADRLHQRRLPRPQLARDGHYDRRLQRRAEALAPRTELLEGERDASARRARRHYVVMLLDHLPRRPDPGESARALPLPSAVLFRTYLEELIAERGGRLEVQLRRCFLHLLLEQLDERLGVHLARVRRHALGDLARLLTLTARIGNARAESHFGGALHHRC